jgi:hypothetical protein
VLQVALEDAGPFRAISYTWRNNNLTHALPTPEEIMKITKSLQDALLALRNNKDVCVPWADAICINQSCTEERQQQIRLMPHIF